MNENNRPLVSVLLLSMNHEQFIERCIRSIEKQTYPNLEIIYLDNASSDNTFKTGKSLLEKSGLPFKTFQNTESRGISENLNFLFNNSKGKYISPLSTDDWLAPENIELKIDYFHNNPNTGMVYNDFQYYNYDTGVFWKNKKRKRKDFKSGWVFKEILKKNFIVTVGNTIKRDTLNNVGLWDEKSPIEDWDMWIRIAEKYQIGFIPKDLAFYGIKSGTNITGNLDYMIKGCNYILNKYSQHKEIKYARNYTNKVIIYRYATREKSLKSLKLILKDFKFEVFYFKQIIKVGFGIINSKLSR